MNVKGIELLLFGVICSLFPSCQSQEFCRAMNYWCKEGHCCGRGKCCTYYYELWWFWFVWLAIAVAGICCFYQKKVKHTPFTRFFGRQTVEERVTNNEAATNTESPPDSQPPDPHKIFHLPTYEEIKDLATDPPSYTQIFGCDASLLQTEITNQTPPSTPPCGPPVYESPISYSQSEAIGQCCSTSDEAPPQYCSNPDDDAAMYAAAVPNEGSQLLACSLVACEDSSEVDLLNNAEPIATTKSTSTSLAVGHYDPV